MPQLRSGWEEEVRRSANVDKGQNMDNETRRGQIPGPDPQMPTVVLFVVLIVLLGVLTYLDACGS
ncbi:hypothetical protein CH256_21605 [Rhodococcus sp. 05-2254-6]|nr:hypothetical protein CH256_21605 [Rhodococcus sp. 05-2254-6]OZE87767.1 hypothetical protein CH305_00980 [Rhodococcus sp. 15-649-2-2]OZE89127.1 hypothetical protein CH302_28985 [Rhodococcus sp. 15-2388-1-1a]